MGFARRLMVAAVGLLCASGGLTHAATNDLAAPAVSGRVEITKRLTKQRVSPTAVYHRGAAVPPANQANVDFVRAELARTAIYIESEAALPARPVRVEINQKSRTFQPETVVIPVGSTVSFPNLDPIFHNVFSLAKPQSFDLGNYPQGETRTVTFKKPGIVPVYCHLHPDMRATIVVSPSAWATIPEPDGSFAFKGLPVGTHTVVVWHRSAGFFRKQIEVGAGKTTVVDFLIPVETGDEK